MSRVVTRVRPYPHRCRQFRKLLTMAVDAVVAAEDAGKSAPIFCEEGRDVQPIAIASLQLATTVALGPGTQPAGRVVMAKRKHVSRDGSHGGLTHDQTQWLLWGWSSEEGKAWRKRQCASRWLECGVPLATIQKWLGHHNISQTSTYLAATHGGDADAMAAFEAAIGRVGAQGRPPGEGADDPEVAPNLAMNLRQRSPFIDGLSPSNHD